MHFVLAVLCTLCFGDWPQFRGPNADGHSAEKSTPMEWSDTMNVAWKVALPGLGWSSPSIADGKVFLTTAVSKGEGLSLQVLALDAATGRTLWEKEVRAVEETPVDSGQKAAQYSGQNCSGRVVAEWDLGRVSERLTRGLSGALLIRSTG